MPFYVTRQRSWPDGTLYVEVESGGADSSSPGMLVAKYPGEMREYDNPQDAAKAAIEIRRLWQADEPDESILIAMGTTGGGLVVQDPADYSDRHVMEWADRALDDMEQCPHCGERVEELEWANPNSEWSGDKFCSERCAERAQEFDDKQEDEAMEWDVTFHGGPGSFSSITGMTIAGREWIEQNVPAESWQQRGPTVYLEGSYLLAIIEAMIDDDLKVEGADEFLANHAD